ncbi:hypothetical protein GCM10010103_57900 [Streptomyces paradoxus]|uniref:Gfo/Idh/MocA-like oxidoreductase C-terminal domain-containing protein n=1 Tax=Streptomyces paradoxus TaxID=66375 RepID=A0A7W9TEH1_9ACTN|nr:hypothetical protein [Streptomyces paradoxus]
MPAESSSDRTETETVRLPTPRAAAAPWWDRAPAPRRLGTRLRRRGLLCVNGSEGRLELLVEESAWTRSPVRDESAVPHGEPVGDTAGRTELMLRRFWEPPRVLEVRTGEGGHGGGDVRMLEDLFGEPVADPLGRAADAVDGARSLVAGLTANRSFELGSPVRTRDLLDV